MSKILDYYKNNIVIRYNPNPLLKYFKKNDFDGLMDSKIEFKSTNGDTIVGAYYYYPGYDDSKLIIFCPGIGPGHIAYMTEIDTICRAGYKVLTFDYIGCNYSSGDNIRGMSEALQNLDCVLNSLNSNKEVIVIGHSWGGYAAGNIINYHKEISKVVIISGFLSIKDLLKQYTFGLSFLSKDIYNYEKEMNPGYVDSNMITTLNNTQTKVMWIHSKDDNMVKYRYSMKKAKRKVKNKNVEFCVMNGRRHNPNYTTDAVDYMKNIFGRLNKEYKNRSMDAKKEFMYKVDWIRMTRQDIDIWVKIFNFIK